MSQDVKAGFLANLPRLQAQSMIMEGRYDPLDFEEIEKLYLAAYGPEKARQAKLESLKQLVRHETEMARSNQ